MDFLMNLMNETKLYILGTIFTLIGVFLLYGVGMTFICGGILTIVFSLILTFLPLMYTYVYKK